MLYLSWFLMFLVCLVIPAVAIQGLATETNVIPDLAVLILLGGLLSEIIDSKERGEK